MSNNLLYYINIIKRGFKMAKEKRFTTLADQKKNYARINECYKKTKRDISGTHNPGKRASLIKKLSRQKAALDNYRRTINSVEAKMGYDRPTTKNEDAFSRSELYYGYLNDNDINFQD